MVFLNSCSYVRGRLPSPRDALHLHSPVLRCPDLEKKNPVNDTWLPCQNSNKFELIYLSTSPFMMKGGSGGTLTLSTAPPERMGDTPGAAPTYEDRRSRICFTELSENLALGGFKFKIHGASCCSKLKYLARNRIKKVAVCQFEKNPVIFTL